MRLEKDFRRHVDLDTCSLNHYKNLVRQLVKEKGFPNDKSLHSKTIVGFR